MSSPLTTEQIQQEIAQLETILQGDDPEEHSSVRMQAKRKAIKSAESIEASIAKSPDQNSAQEKICNSAHSAKQGS